MSHGLGYPVGSSITDGRIARSVLVCFSRQTNTVFGSKRTTGPGTERARVDEIANEIARAAASAAEFCRTRTGELDYSEASLTVVEELLAGAAGFVTDLDPDQAVGLIQDVGCYILEVGRREFGGRYQWHASRDQPVLVVGEPAFRVALLAWDKVRGRLGGDTGDNIPFFYAGFAERARRAEPGTDALYV
jgi:hypothetical protein